MRSLLRLVEPQSGSVILDDKDIIALNTRELREARRDMQMVFQDPFGSLNPQRNLADQVAEPLQNYLSLARSERQERVAQLRRRTEVLH